MNKNNNNIIIFGGSGFIGSHVADILSEEGHNVTIFDLKKSPFLRQNQKMFIGDIKDKNALDDAMKNNQIVYNFAGISDIDECHKDPISSIKMNILGNALIIESSIRNSVEKYLFASSAYVYSSFGSFYRICKQSSEQIIESYANENDIEYTILRYGSLYGNRADNRNSLYKIINSALEKKKIDYFGDGFETREFIHVNDAARLSVQAIDKKFNSQILMLTGKKSIKYVELLEMIKEIIDEDIEINMHPKKSDTHYKISPYSFNPKLAKKLTINPHIDLGQGILNLISDIYRKLNPDLDKDYNFTINK